MNAIRFTLIVLLLTAVLAGCNRLQPTIAQAPPAPKPPEVMVDLPRPMEVTDFEEFTGRTMAQPSIDIRSHVTGYLDKIYFKEGADVKAGDMLYEIDPRPYQAEVDRAQGNLVQAQAHVKRLTLDMQRATTMLPAKTISREDYDRITGDLAESDAAVTVAKANVDLAKQNLDYTQIRAKISGRMSRTLLDAGNLVKADDTVLSTIVSLDPIYVTFGVDERLLKRVHSYVSKGLVKPIQESQVPVLMGLANEDGFPQEGTVNFVDNHLDQSTASLQVHGVFANPRKTILPGLFARVRLPLGEPYRALTIPDQALGTDQGQKFVYVIDSQNKVEYRKVEVGRKEGMQRVILKGVNEGDRVVVSGLQRIRPGVIVEPKMASATASVAIGKGTETQRGHGKAE